MKELEDEAPPAPGARARRPLVPGGARRQAHHRQGRLAQDRRGARCRRRAACGIRRYVEKSWIAAEPGGKPIRLIPWLQEKIAARYPGTKLAMTEYDFGGGDHISGGLAQADVLGVFGREGVYLANYWGNGAGNGHAAELHQGGLPALPELRRQGRRLRRHGGRGRRPADQGKASIFAATDSKHPGR